MSTATLATALVLEDEPILGFALEDMLLDLGFGEVALVATIEEATRYLAGRTPDLAILDVNIHGQRSYAVADALVAAEVPFAFATGYGDAEHPDHLRNVPTLTKPYSPDDLRKFVEDATGSAQPDR